MVRVIYTNIKDEIKELQFEDEYAIEAIIVAEALKGEVKID